MGKRSAPRMPDPIATSQQQFDLNRQAAMEAARMNQINQQTPWGGTYWTGEIGSPDRTQHTLLNPALGQIIFGSGYGDGGLADIMAQQQAAQAPAPEPEMPQEAEMPGKHGYWNRGGGYMPGFEMGGYTGAGMDGMVQPDRVAGVVHEGEYVVPAQETSRLARLMAQAGQPGMKHPLDPAYSMVTGAAGGIKSLIDMLSGGGQQQGMMDIGETPAMVPGPAQVEPRKPMRGLAGVLAGGR